MFYHSMLALSPVSEGLAPFFAATGSFRRARDATLAMSPELQDEIVPDADETRTALPGHLRPVVADWVEYEEVDSEQLSDLPEADRHPRQVPAEYTEINLDVGSLLILDPML